MKPLNLHEFHQTVTKTATGLSESLDRLSATISSAPEPMPASIDAVRKMKAQLRVLIDQGIALGQELERADAADDADPSQLTSSDSR